MDVESKAILLRVALIMTLLFGVFSFKPDSTFSVMRKVLDILSIPKRYLNVGLVIVRNESGVYGNFSLATLSVLTFLLIGCFLVSPATFGLVLGLPLRIMRYSTFSWNLLEAGWHIPINVIVTIVIFWCGFMLCVVLWTGAAAIVVKTFSWFAEIIRSRFSHRVFDAIALVMLAMSILLAWLCV